MINVAILGGSMRDKAKSILETTDGSLSKFNVVGVYDTADDLINGITKSMPDLDVIIAIDSALSVSHAKEDFAGINEVVENIEAFSSTSVKMITCSEVIEKAFKEELTSKRHEIHLFEELHASKLFALALGELTPVEETEPISEDVAEVAEEPAPKPIGFGSKVHKKSFGLSDTSQSTPFGAKLDKKKRVPFVKQQDKPVAVEETRSESIAPIKQKSAILPGYAKRKRESNISVNVDYDWSKANGVHIVTGTRASGVSSTVANLGVILASKGISTAIIDLDIKTKGIQMQLPRFTSALAMDHKKKTSLLDCLRKPERFFDCAVDVTENLFLTSLDYSIQARDIDLDPSTVVNLVTSLIGKVGVILVDLPLEYLTNYKDLTSMATTVSICLSNNYHSIYATAQELEYVFYRDAKIIKNLMEAKVRFIGTDINVHSKHAGKAFSRESVADVWLDTSAIFDKRFDLVGWIPRYEDMCNYQFKSLIDNAEMMSAYAECMATLLTN